MLTHRTRSRAENEKNKKPGQLEWAGQLREKRADSGGPYQVSLSPSHGERAGERGHRHDPAPVAIPLSHPMGEGTGVRAPSVPTRTHRTRSRAEKAKESTETTFLRDRY